MFKSLFSIYQSTKPLVINEGIEGVQEAYEQFMQPDYFMPEPLIYDFASSMPSDPFKLELEFPTIQIDTKQPSYRYEPSDKILKGPKSFEEAFNKAKQINPDISKYRNFLIKTAKRESGFNSYIQNRAGAPYYGYFQMGREEIKRTTGLTVEQFRNDPVAQILGAVKLYEMNIKTIKAIGVYDIGKKKGYSDDALVSGAWMGGPGGVKKYLLGLGDPSDSHWYKNGKGGSSVGKIMNNWKENE